MLCHLLVATAVAAAPASTLKLDAPATDALMLLARNTGLNVFTTSLSGRVKGEFPLSRQEVLIRGVLGQIQEPVAQREDFVFAGRTFRFKGFPKADITPGPKVFLWEREIPAGNLARLLSLYLKRPVMVAAPFDQELVTVVLNDATADEALAGLAFLLNQSIAVGPDGELAIGPFGTAVTRECRGFSLNEWTRLSGYAPGPYPFGLLQTGGVSCPTETGRTVRTADGDLLKAIGPDDDAAMVYRWVSGAKEGTFVKVSFEGTSEVRGCEDITRDSRLKRVNALKSFAVLTQGLIECAVTRNVKAGGFEILDIDANGAYVRNHTPGAKTAVVQVTSQGIVTAAAPVLTR